jgi:hypothetical protein
MRRVYPASSDKVGISQISPGGIGVKKLLKRTGITILFLAITGGVVAWARTGDSPKDFEVPVS